MIKTWVRELYDKYDIQNGDLGLGKFGRLVDEIIKKIRRKKYLRHYYRSESKARKKSFSSYKFWAMNEREALDQYETKHGLDWKKIEVHQIDKPYAGCYGCFEIKRQKA